MLSDLTAECSGFAHYTVTSPAKEIWKTIMASAMMRLHLKKLAMMYATMRIMHWAMIIFLTADWCWYV